MTIQVTLEFDTLEEAAEALRDLAGSYDESAVDAANAADPSKPKRKRRTKAELAAAAAAGGASAPPAPAATPAAPAPVAPAQPAPAAPAAGLDFMGGPAAPTQPTAPVALTPEQALAKLTHEVRPALAVVLQAKGQDVARSLVQSPAPNGFGVANLDALPPAQYDAFIARARALGA